MSQVIDFTDLKYIKFLEAENKMGAIGELGSVFDNTSVCDNADILVQALKEREEIMSTGIGFGIAIPHVKIDAVKEMAFAIGISKKGIAFDSMDGEPVHIIIMVAAGEKQHKEYLRLLSNIMAILKKGEVKDRIIDAGSSEEVIEILAEE
ncbi:MAG: PTS sugar transporter subunit IIA [Spirochaetes bacterium]|nr:PTS sugar transporter subunit IIA [Spirochaetota bacterium]